MRWAAADSLPALLLAPPCLLAGLRNDGAQVLQGCYQRIREVESMRGIPSGVDLCFGLHLTQGVQCGACGKVRCVCPL